MTQQPPIAETLAELARLLARELDRLADDLESGRLTSWQLCGVAGDLSQAQKTVHRMQRDAGRLADSAERS